MKLRLMVAEARLKIAIEALNKIAAWDDGPVVTSKFDNPHDAKIAREALEKMKVLKVLDKGDKP